MQRTFASLPVPNRHQSEVQFQIGTGKQNNFRISPLICSGKNRFHGGQNWRAIRSPIGFGRMIN
jgi:hypothetical protein